SSAYSRSSAATSTLIDAIALLSSSKPRPTSPGAGLAARSRALAISWVAGGGRGGEGPGCGPPGLAMGRLCAVRGPDRPGAGRAERAAPPLAQAGPGQVGCQFAAPYHTGLPSGPVWYARVAAGIVRGLRHNLPVATQLSFKLGS